MPNDYRRPDLPEHVTADVPGVAESAVEITLNTAMSRCDAPAGVLNAQESCRWRSPRR